MLKTAALASGSSGNSYFVKNEEGLFIFDIGISLRQLKQRLENFSLTLSDITAVFISHEHGDHIKGLKTFVRNFPDIPIFISTKTYWKIKDKYENGSFVFFNPGDKIAFKSFEIFLHKKYHDAIEPVFFKIVTESGVLSIITDFGFPNREIIKAVSQSRVLFLEFNYDLNMLESGFYPEILKDRIKSRLGHLSNCDASALLKEYGNGNLDYLVISHVSEKNNTYTKALNSAKKNIGESSKIIIAKQKECSTFIEIF